MKEYFTIIRTIEALGPNVWSIVAHAEGKEAADHARDFFEANWPYEKTGVDGVVNYRYEVIRDV